MKNTRKTKKASEVKKPTPPVTERDSVYTASLAAGRMADFFGRLYVYIFSVNITLGVYQIESGRASLAAEPFAVRGYYDELIANITKELIDDHRAPFSKAFSRESIRNALLDGKTSISECYCGMRLERGHRSEDRDTGIKWYEFCAEWTIDTDPANIVAAFSVRGINGDMDNGSSALHAAELVHAADGGIDWASIRAERLSFAANRMDFEYDAGEDKLILHRRSDGTAKRVQEHFLSGLAARADFVFSHESIADIRALLTIGDDTVKSSVILCRKEATFGAPFLHYKMTAATVIADGRKWVIGALEDIEADQKALEQNAELTRAMGSLFKISGISMYYINAHQGTICTILQDENGLHRVNTRERLADYITKRISSGRIAPESQKEYEKWLEKGYLQRKTADGKYEFEAMVKDMLDEDYQWYQETIIPIDGRKDQYFRWRRNETDAHRVRDEAYEHKQIKSISDYNRKMLDTLANLIEFRSVESTGHISRVRMLTKLLLTDLKKRSPQYGITNAEIEMYVQAATMHDVGKISVPDYILNKPGEYTPAEFEIMKKHTTDGAAIIDRISMPGFSELQKCIRDVALHHHERFDGKGYPDGLKGDEIAIGVQAVSLADVYDALMSERCYKQSYSPEAVVGMIYNNECGTFNPLLYESLKVVEDKMRRVYKSLN